MERFLINLTNFLYIIILILSIITSIFFIFLLKNNRKEAIKKFEEKRKNKNLKFNNMLSTLEGFYVNPKNHFDNKIELNNFIIKLTAFYNNKDSKIFLTTTEKEFIFKIIEQLKNYKFN